MFYRLDNSTDTKVIGYVNSQAEHALFEGHVNNPYLSRNIVYKRIKEADLDKVITVKPILVKRAKLTDLISGSSTGHGTQLVMSDKLKRIIEKQKYPGIQFFPMTIIYKDQELNNYWLGNPTGDFFDMDFIDFKHSTTLLKDLYDYTKTVSIAIANLDEFNNKLSELKIPKALHIKSLVLNSGRTNKEFFMLDKVKGGVSYYVSEKLKKEIEDAGCTGIEFEPIEEA